MRYASTQRIGTVNNMSAVFAPCTCARGKMISLSVIVVVGVGTKIARYQVEFTHKSVWVEMRN